ncbi:hypothetical protein EON62_01555, partial [archaeon]
MLPPPGLGFPHAPLVLETPVKAALIFSLEPVFAAILAVMFIDDPMGAREYYVLADLMYADSDALPRFL